MKALPVSATYGPNGRFLAGYDFISENSPGLPTNFVSNDGDGRDPDPSDPGDWVTQRKKPSSRDLVRRAG